MPHSDDEDAAARKILGRMSRVKSYNTGATKADAEVGRLAGDALKSMPVREKAAAAPTGPDMRVQYVDFDPADKAKGRIGVRGAGRALTAEEQAFVRKNYGLGPAEQHEAGVMRRKLQPKSSGIKFSMGGGPMQEFDTGRAGVLETIDSSALGQSMGKRREEDEAARKLLERRQELEFKKQEMEMDPEYQHRKWQLERERKMAERQDSDYTAEREQARQQRGQDYQMRTLKETQAAEREQRQRGMIQATGGVAASQLAMGASPQEASRMAEAKGEEQKQRDQAARQRLSEILLSQGKVKEAMALQAQEGGSLQGADPAALAAATDTSVDDLRGQVRRAGTVVTPKEKQRIQSIVQRAKAAGRSEQEIQDVLDEMGFEVDGLDLFSLLPGGLPANILRRVRENF